MFGLGDIGSRLAITSGLGSLVTYVMCGNIARKSPALGGGTGAAFFLAEAFGPSRNE